MRRNVIVHPGADRPDVEVLVEERGWVVGEARMQWQEGDGAWWVQVQYADGNHSRLLGNFHADQVRADETDHSRGWDQHTE